MMESILQVCTETYYKGIATNIIESSKRGDIGRMAYSIANIIIHSFQGILIIFFVCLAQYASMAFQVIIDDVQNHQPSFLIAVKLPLAKWKRGYFLTLSFVEKLDGFFGISLVIFTSTLYFHSVKNIVEFKKTIFSKDFTQLVANVLEITEYLMMTIALTSTTKGMRGRVIFFLQLNS